MPEEKLNQNNKNLKITFYVLLYNFLNDLFQVRPVLEQTGPWSTGNRSRESLESGVLSVRANVNSLTQLLADEVRQGL